MNLKEVLRISKSGESVVDALSEFEKGYTGEDYNNIEIIEVEKGRVGIAYDSDFEELMDELGITSMSFDYPGSKTYAYVNIDGISKDMVFYFFSDGDASIVVPTLVFENRHGEGLGDEEFLLFEEIIDVSHLDTDKCDICNQSILTDLLLNIDPSNTQEGEFKEKYIGFDGMVCNSCYDRIALKTE